MDRITITNDFDQSYNELKSGLKDKYLNMLYGFIDDAEIIPFSAQTGEGVEKLKEIIEGLRD